jgi:Na+-transporting NADH:ubiquinone oxidoreductase subunit C
MSAKNDTVSKTFLVAFLLCLVCSIVVSSAAVFLKPVQQANKLDDMRKNILAAAGLYNPSQNIKDQFEVVDIRIVNLEQGRYASDEELAEIKAAGFDPKNFDHRKAMSDAKLSNKLDYAEDIASIKRLETFAPVYLIKNPQGGIDKLILPIRGYGLWSTLHGFVALKGDVNTVVGLGFYDHAETPGLGGEVDNPAWKALWPGKQVYNAQGEVALSVIKGKVDTQSPKAVYQVDGLSGATLTTRGLDNLVHFWFSQQGFGKFLDSLKAKGA